VVHWRSMVSIFLHGGVSAEGMQMVVLCLWWMVPRFMPTFKSRRLKIKMNNDCKIMKLDGTYYSAFNWQKNQGVYKHKLIDYEKIKKSFISAFDFGDSESLKQFMQKPSNDKLIPHHKKIVVYRKPCFCCFDKISWMIL
jgi:hypothetical protein